MASEQTGTFAAGATAESAAPLIAHVIYRLHTGGMENGLVNLVNRLPRDRCRHVIVCITDSTDFARRLQRDDVAIHALHKRPGKDPGFYLRFWRLMRRLRPAIVHTRNLGALDLAPVAALAGVPVRIHGEHGWDAADATGASARYRRLRRLCNVAVTRYVAVSRDISRWLQSRIGVASNKVEHICNGVDVDRFRPEGMRADIRGTATLVIGSVGRMDPIKGFDVLIDAFAALAGDSRRGAVRLRLVIVGDGSLRGDMEQKAGAAGIADSVYFAGDRPDMPDVLRGLDIFVLASRNEGISNTVLEAMATGLPIVATKVGGNPELIADGRTGQLVAPGDVDALAGALARYVDDESLRRSHGAAARQAAVETFSLESMLAGYQRLYDHYLYNGSR